MTTIGINDFCNRQISVNHKSEFGGFEGNKKELLDLISKLTENKKLESPVEIVRFYTDDPEYDHERKFLCSYAPIERGEQVELRHEVRRQGEQPITVKLVHRSCKYPALTVDFVLYSKVALGGEATTDADYELVSINGMPRKIPEGQSEPMTPQTLWRNYLSRIPDCPAGIGGTFQKRWEDEATFRKELAESQKYWEPLARVIVD